MRNILILEAGGKGRAVELQRFFALNAIIRGPEGLFFQNVVELLQLFCRSRSSRPTASSRPSWGTSAAA